MVTSLSPDNEAFLQHVVSIGRFPSREAAIEEAVQTLRKTVGDPPQDAESQESTDEWIARIRAWSESHRAVESFVDDSRDSIY
jgi:hypothetical protein